ncbi:MAG: hypothetical protein N2V75_08185 [Methanophagales archaeon]|nr:hypothetical protein [Methanophagales archaeon]
MYIRNIADIPPKWKGNTQCGYNAKSWSDICTTADIPELYEIGG